MVFLGRLEPVNLADLSDPIYVRLRITPDRWSLPKAAFLEQL